ncbi:MAG: transketolase [Bacilli bacterium]|nr:transketolase [Bacilli bacterium]
MDNQVISYLKSLSIDMIYNAQSGHPGIVLGAAPIMYTLFSKHLNINTSDSKWINKDRFVMSAGHGSALLYATLYMAGFNINIDDLKNFRNAQSITPGHPEYKVTPGVDITTGPLGQGFASAVGMAIAEAKLKQETQLNKKNTFESNKSLIDHKIYVLASDGDLMEGISYEAASIAGTLKLNDLIVLYDSNDFCLSSSNKKTFNENVCSRFNSMGWNTILVKNGNSVKQIDIAIKKAKKSNKPTLIEIKTIIGKDSTLENTNEIHGKKLNKDDVNQIKNNLNLPKNEFYVDENIKNAFAKQISVRTNNKYSQWSKNYQELINDEKLDINKFKFLFNKDDDIDILNMNFDLELREATRITNKKIINYISQKLPNFIGGSADLAEPTGCYLDNMKDISANDYSGKNIFFGVREHAMGAILNGLALYNYIPFGSTFLSFSDYLKPAMRLSCIMDLPVTYIFSHDSINIGQDGPTHQPIEQLASLRAIPNMNVYRPCDANELLGCWNLILKNKKPSSLILSRIDVPIMKNSSKTEISKGAYIIEKEKNDLKGIIIATGTDVYTAFYIANDIYRELNISLRVISMPNRELFLKQDKKYQEEILPKGYKKFVIEAGSSLGWEQFVYDEKYLFTLNKFGISGTKDDVLKYMNFDYEAIKTKIINLL